MKSPRPLVRLLAVTGLLISPAGSQTVALDIAAGSIGNQPYGGALGMDFVVNGTVTVTDLGCFDSGSDGLSLPITVELWRRNDGGTPDVFTDDTGDSILAFSNFTPGDEGTLEEGNRFKPLTVPVALNEGAYSIVAWGYGMEEPNGNDGGLGNFPTTVTDSIAIDFVGTSRFGDVANNGQFPDTPDGGPATRYGAGTFKFSTADTDGDGLPDLWEEQFGLNKNDPDDADDDGDSDGLDNLGEFDKGTDPTDDDTDDDGLKDGEEVDGAGDRPPTNPRVADTDGDELSDLVETNTRMFVDEDDTGTDPTNPDTDGDTFPDKPEILAGTDPNDPAPPFPPPPFSGFLAITSDQTVGNQDFAGSLGSDFIVNSPIEVTELGAFDDNLDGIGGSDLGVAIFERNDAGTPLDPADDTGGAIVTQTTFTSGNAGALSGSYRLKPVPVVTLDPGAYTIVGWGYGAGDSNGNDGNLGNWPTTIDDGGGLIEFVGVSRFGDAGVPGTFPNTPDGGPTVRYGAGTFAYRAPAADPLRLQLSGSGGDLVLRWNSKAGKVYDILWNTDPSADPMTWPVYLDRTNIAATPDTNFETIPRPGDERAFFVILEKEAPPLYEDDFEGGQGGWTVGVDDVLAGDTNWEFGAPSNVGPPAPRSGSNCFGTNLGANYDTDADIWLRSPPIDLTDGAITGASVRFYQFKDIELMFDAGVVRVLDAATDLPLGAEVLSIDGTSADWEEVERDLPPEALGKSIKLEFRFTSDEFGEQAGWYVDDVAVKVR